MAKFAVIDTSNNVCNIIVAESLEIALEVTGATCVELPEYGFGIGDSYDGTQFIKAPDLVTGTPTE